MIYILKNLSKSHSCARRNKTQMGQHVPTVKTIYPCFFFSPICYYTTLTFSIQTRNYKYTHPLLIPALGKATFFYMYIHICVSLQTPNPLCTLSGVRGSE